jgi:hypothetical protein
MGNLSVTFQGVNLSDEDQTHFSVGSSCPLVNCKSARQPAFLGVTCRMSPSVFKIAQRKRTHIHRMRFSVLKKLNVL